MPEKRRSVRFRPSGALYGRVKSVPAKVVDISLHGAQVELCQSLPRRAEYRLVLPAPEGSLELRAVVRRCMLTDLKRAGEAAQEAHLPRLKAGDGLTIYRAGLEFMELQPEQLAVLERTCAEQEGCRPSLEAMVETSAPWSSLRA
jgi:hypothetical protein